MLTNFLFISMIFCIIIYAVSIIETIGSYILSVEEFGNYSTFYMYVSIFIPPLAPVIAWAIFSTAKELYDSKKPNVTEVDESFYGFIIHGFKTINKWSNKKNNGK